MGRGNPAIYDIATLISAGIDPKTKLPIKFTGGTAKEPELKFNARRIFRIIDEQRAIQTFKWYNLPYGISSEELERLIYLKYSLVFFYMEELNQFFFMPYALDGTIDFYGRFNTVHPVPMTSGAEKETDSKEYKQKAALLSTKKLTIQKDVIVYRDQLTDDVLKKSGVILRDYSNQMGQMGEPRYILNDRLIELEADCIPFIRTNLILATGIQGLRVTDADVGKFEASMLAQKMYTAALNGEPYTALTANAELQELQPNSTTKASEYFLALQSIDNLLLSTHGLENTGLYEKKAHILESENQVNATNVSLTLADRLAWRQNFCNIVNSIWDLGMWCEVAEPVVGMDMNQDGIPYDENGNAGSSEEQQEEE